MCFCLKRGSRQVVNSFCWKVLHKLLRYLLWILWKVYDCSSVLCVICEVSWQNRQLTLKRSCPQNTAGFKRLVFYYTICQFSATPLLAIDGPVKIVSTYVGHHCVKCTVRAAHQDFKMPFYPKNFLESAEPLKMTCIHTHQFQIHTTHGGFLSTWLMEYRIPKCIWGWICGRIHPHPWHVFVS